MSKAADPVAIAGRFEAKVARAGDSDCHLWTAAHAHGDAVFFNGVKTVRACVFAWEQAHGPLADGFTVRQTCECRSCVNLAHLELVEARRGSSTRRGGAARKAAGDVSSTPRYIRLARLLRAAGDLAVPAVADGKPVVDAREFGAWWTVVRDTLDEYGLTEPDGGEQEIRRVVAAYALPRARPDVEHQPRELDRWPKPPARRGDRRERIRILACDECPQTFGHDRVRDLIRHTVAVHGRRPTAAERTPIDDDAATTAA